MGIQSLVDSVDRRLSGSNNLPYICLRSQKYHLGRRNQLGKQNIVFYPQVHFGNLVCRYQVGKRQDFKFQQRSNAPLCKKEGL